jgi:type IV pilus assembly protein PilE
MLHRLHHKGFQLVELLVVLAIMAILTSLSFPLYTAYLVKERRFEAAALLSQLAIAAEHYHLQHNSYARMSLAVLHTPAYIVKHNYHLMLQLMDAGYVLTAQPIHAQAIHDTDCGALTLNEMGERTVTGKASVETCW